MQIIKILQKDQPVAWFYHPTELTLYHNWVMPGAISSFNNKEIST